MPHLDGYRLAIVSHKDQWCWYWLFDGIVLQRSQRFPSYDTALTNAEQQQHLRLSSVLAQCLRLVATMNRAGCAPTLTMVARATGLHSNAVRLSLGILCQKGVLYQRGDVYRLAHA